MTDERPTFHAGDGWFLTREPTGHVTIGHSPTGHPGGIDRSVTLDAATWAAATAPVAVTTRDPSLPTDWFALTRAVDGSVTVAGRPDVGAPDARPVTLDPGTWTAVVTSVLTGDAPVADDLRERLGRDRREHSPETSWLSTDGDQPASPERRPAEEPTPTEAALARVRRLLADGARRWTTDGDRLVDWVRVDDVRAALDRPPGPRPRPRPLDPAAGEVT